MNKRHLDDGSLGVSLILSFLGPHEIYAFGGDCHRNYFLHDFSDIDTVLILACSLGICSLFSFELQE